MNPLIEKIHQAHQRDLERNREAVTAEQLPTSYEAVTDRWLTAVLCASVPGATVLGHRLSAPDSGSSNRRKIYLQYDAAGEAAGLPRAVFCKATHDLSNKVVLGVSGAARGETLFYTSVRPLLDIVAPVCRFALMEDETFNSMIILDDLTDDVVEFCNHKTVMTRQRAISQMRLLGRLHGRCYGDPELRQRIAEFPTFSEFFDNTLQFGMREGSEAGFRAGEEVIPARLFKRHQEIWPATVAAIESLDQAPRTFTHGDVHLKNWYVAASGDMGLSDWQCVGRAQWSRDVAYTIGTALTVEDRRAWERDLLRYYLEQLAQAGGPRIDFGAAWDAYRRQMISALTWWTVTLRPTPDIPDMLQPRDITIEFVRRLATAMDDLDSLAA